MATQVQAAIGKFKEAENIGQLGQPGFSEAMTTILRAAAEGFEGHDVEYSILNDGTYHLCNACLRYAVWSESQQKWRHAMKSELKGIRDEIEADRKLSGVGQELSVTGSNEPWKGLSEQSDWETTHDYVSRLIGEAVGAGGMAWPIIGGVFKEAYAKSISDDTANVINSLLEAQGKRLQDTVTLETHNAVVAQKEILASQLKESQDGNMKTIEELHEIFARHRAALKQQGDEHQRAWDAMREAHQEQLQRYEDRLKELGDLVRGLQAKESESEDGDYDGAEDETPFMHDVYRPQFNLVEVIRAVRDANL